MYKDGKLHYSERLFNPIKCDSQYSGPQSNVHLLVIECFCHMDYSYLLINIFEHLYKVYKKYIFVSRY